MTISKKRKDKLSTSVLGDKELRTTFLELRKTPSLTRSEEMNETVKQLFQNALLRHLEKYFVASVFRGTMTDIVTVRLAVGKEYSGGRYFSPSGRLMVSLDSTEITQVKNDVDLENVIDVVTGEATDDIMELLLNWAEIAQQKLTLDQILKLKNIEQRVAALKIYGIERLLEDKRTKLIDKSERGNELYLLEGVFQSPAYFLKYKDMSTDRVYFSGVDPEFASKNPTADACMSWKFHWTLDQYSELKTEA